jgi:DNA polymerase IV (DinB-like DNA polymerase)
LQDFVLILVDFDYFFAQIEERRNASLKDKPVVICVYSGRSENSGAVSTANYLAREYGVKSGMPIALAKKKLEGIESALLPVDHGFYGQVSENVMTILKGYADRFEQVGIDEAYLDVSRKTGASFEKAEELAQEIKIDIKNQQKLTCSIGIGPNKLVAKMAADSQKPDGLTVVRPEQVESFLSPLLVSRLIGVGAKTREKMQSLGVGTVGELAVYDVHKLIAVFGKTLGAYFHNVALGIDDKPVQERREAESIGRISTLKANTRDLNVVLEKADKLCEEVHATLVQRGFGFKSVGIVTVLMDMSIHSRSETLEIPTNDLDVLKKTVRTLFERFLDESRLEIRRVGVKASNFVKKERKQRQITSFIDSNVAQE